MGDRTHFLGMFERRQPRQRPFILFTTRDEPRAQDRHVRRRRRRSERTRLARPFQEDRLQRRRVDWLWQVSRDEALQSLTSIEMQELGGVHRLTREGAEVSVQSAKWHWIADIMPDNGLRSLARSIAQSNEPTLLSAGVPIFAAARAQDNARTRTAILALMPQLIPRVIESADPELALNYLKASSATIDYLGSIEAWEECANAVGGRGLSDPQAIPPNIARAEFESLAEAIRSASAAQWVRRPIPHVAAADAEVALDAAIRAANSQGLDNTLFESDARTRCLMTYLLMAEVNRRDPLQAVAIHRTYWTQ